MQKEKLESTSCAKRNIKCRYNPFCVLTIILNGQSNLCLPSNFASTLRMPNYPNYIFIVTNGVRL